MFKKYHEVVRCEGEDKPIRVKFFFIFSFNCLVTGYLDLLVKIFEIILLIVVKFFQLVMFIFPWRKPVLNEKIAQSKIICN